MRLFQSTTPPSLHPLPPYASISSSGTRTTRAGTDLSAISVGLRAHVPSHPRVHPIVRRCVTFCPRPRPRLRCAP